MTDRDFAARQLLRTLDAAAATLREEVNEQMQAPDRPTLLYLRSAVKSLEQQAETLARLLTDRRRSPALANRAEDLALYFRASAALVRSLLRSTRA